MSTSTISSPKLFNGFPPQSIFRKKREQDEITFAIGLDGTLVTLLRDARGNLIHSANHDSITVVNPVYRVPLQYRLAHGAEEFVKALSSIPRAKISFFSAGKKWRNDELVKQLMERIDARWPGKKTPYKVISAVTDIKDLELMGNQIDLSHAILIDHCTPVQATEAGHMLKIRHVHAKTNGYFASGKNDLFFALGMIMEALQATAELKIGIMPALASLQATIDLEGCGSKSDAVKAIYERGLEEMRKYNPNIDFLP